VVSRKLALSRASLAVVRVFVLTVTPILKAVGTDKSNALAVAGQVAASILTVCFATNV